MRAGLVAVALLCAVAAAPAVAAPTELDAGRGLIAPRLAGQSIVAFAGSGTRVVRVDPGGSRTTLRELDRPARAQLYEAEVAASASHVAVARFFEVHRGKAGGVEESSFRLEAGPLGGPLVQLFECPGDHVFDVDGTRLAYSDACTGGPGAGNRIVVRDLAVEGAPVVQTIEAPAGISAILPLDLAGDHVAYGTFAGNEPRIAVVDLATGTEAYGYTGRYAGYSLQADGKLAVVRAPDCAVEWLAKAEPVAHTLELCPSGGILRLRDDRIAFVQAAARNAVLEIGTLDGARRPIATFEPSAAVGGFDFDGNRAAYVARGCVEANSRLFVDDLAPGDAPVEGGPCPGSLLSRTVRASDSGLLRVRVRCPQGCFGTLELFNTGRRASERAATVDFRGGARTVLIRLKPRVRRQLRRAGSMVMKTPLSVRQRDGSFRSFAAPLNVLAPR